MEVALKKRKLNSAGDEELKHVKIRIGTRKSQLAMWQANHTAGLLRDNLPNTTFDVVGLQTTGDKDQATSLSQFSNKGVFTKELDIALINNKIDMAVHCIKDLPTTLPKGLELAAIMERGPVGDVVVLAKKHQGKKLSELAPGSAIGTGAFRRRAMLGRHFPHLKFKDIRGNLNTRIRKLDEGQYDGIILARIGLERIKFENRISEDLDILKYGYAVGQGALGIVTRANDETAINVAKHLDHTLTRWQCTCERGMLFTLEGGCKLPVVVRTNIDKNNNNKDHKGYTMSVWGGVLSVDGKEMVEATVKKDFNLDQDQVSRAYQLGCDVAQILRENGAIEILKKIKDDAEANKKN